MFLQMSALFNTNSLKLIPFIPHGRNNAKLAKTNMSVNKRLKASYAYNYLFCTLHINMKYIYFIS